MTNFNQNSNVKRIEFYLKKLFNERTKKIHACQIKIKFCKEKTAEGNQNYGGATTIWEDFLKKAKKKPTTIELSTAFLECSIKNRRHEQFISDLKYAEHSGIFVLSGEKDIKTLLDKTLFSFDDLLMSPKFEYLNRHSPDSKKHQIQHLFLSVLLKTPVNKIRVGLNYFPSA